MIEYAEPFNAVEKAIREAENERVRADYENERQNALNKAKEDKEARARKLAEDQREKADLL